jgi:hypothetical protein
MELASGYSDSINYGNGYTPLATNAINNNNASYAANQEYARLMGQYDPFAQSGGFGAMTDYYSGLGAAYGRAVGGGGNIYATQQPQEPQQPQEDLVARYWELMGGGGGGGASFNDRFSAAPAITPGLQPQGGDYSAFPNAISAGVDPSADVNIGNNSFNSRFGAWPEQPNPATGIMNQGGGQEDLVARYYELMGGGGRSQTQTPAPFGGPDTNLYGYPSSGSLGTMNSFGGYQPDAPLGQGGIGSDTARDRIAWTLAQSSPFAAPGAPANGPYPNLGYNPGMSNYFANPTMQQYDWTKNNDALQQQLNDALKTIDSATGQKPAEPYGGELPSFWQGVRDWTGMGAPQPTSTYQPSS